MMIIFMYEVNHYKNRNKTKTFRVRYKHKDQLKPVFYLINKETEIFDLLLVIALVAELGFSVSCP
jgi:hypothetical protein